jgi:hypothetical protein
MAELVDVTPVGLSVGTATDEVAARTAIGAENVATKAQPGGYAPLGADSLVPAVHLPARTAVNLRDWVDVAAANWKTFLGLNSTAGSTTVSNVPFTAADVGKVIVVKQTSGEWWMTTIASVAGTSAVVDDPAPATGTNLRCNYGFDGTAAINSALAEINASADGPTEVYLGGSYRLTQLVIPSKVRLSGVPWSASVGMWLSGNPSETVLAQLPGAEKDFVVFEGTVMGTNTVLAFCGLKNMVLWGPEKRTTGVTVSKGNGLAFATPAGAPCLAIDGFVLEHVTANNFPGSGFRSYGAIPLYVNNCKALYNGRYGLEHRRTEGQSTNAMHVLNFSGDWNNLGLMYFGILQPNDTLFITGVKSEGTSAVDDPDGNLWAGPNYQSNCLVFEDCDATPIVVNGLSHLRVARAGSAPGPAITITDSTNGTRKPKLVFNAVVTRVAGTETGSTADAVTVKDVAGNTTLPRTVTSGAYPTATAPLIMVDNFGNRILRFVGNATSTAYLDLYNSPSGGPPILNVTDATQSNVGFAIQPKGTGSLQIGGTAPRLSTTGTTNNLNLTGSGTGVVQVWGTQVEVKGHTHVAGDVTGAAAWVAIPATQVSPGTPGQVAYDAVNNFLYVCVAANSWRRTAISGW